MATLLVHIAIPLEAHPGQLELGCKNMWPNHADKGRSLRLEILRDFRDAGFVGHCLGRFLVDPALFTEQGIHLREFCAPGKRVFMQDKGQRHKKTWHLSWRSWISVFGRKSGSGMPFAVGDVASWVDLGACDGATDFDDVLIAQPFGVANEGPFFVHLFFKMKDPKRQQQNICSAPYNTHNDLS
ncbi:hypothetical protein C8J57DRAFT_1228393 [Mycena rebaudengoi]|nr:hypothetical protein C8J57DRAFT_1228393 [Mycena rebaudengoi]